MKYKLINSVTKVETICDKVTIEGFDYYVSDIVVNGCTVIFNSDSNVFHKNIKIDQTSVYDFNNKLLFDKEGTLSVIATNNPNIDIPKVVDQIQINKEKNQELIDLINHTLPNEQLTLNQQSIIYHHGKSQETHSNSDEDMIEFAEWRRDFEFTDDFSNYEKEELLQLWKQQQPKIVYYE